MIKSTRAFIDGVPLISVAPINWQITEGVDPFMTSIIMDKASGLLTIEAANKKNSNSPFFRLLIERGTTTAFGDPGPKEFNNLVLVSYEPFSDPRFLKLNFADNRIFWNRSYFRGDFNIRGSLGDKFVTKYLTGGAPLLSDFGGAIPLQNENVIKYRTYSLFPPLSDRSTESEPRPWTTKEMIERIFLKINNDLPFSQAIDIDSLNSAIGNETLLKEEIELDGPSGSCLHQILQIVPNLGIYVDKEGKAVFYEKDRGGEIGVLNSFVNIYEGSEYPIYVDNSFFVPSHVEVLFESEFELRFDFIEVSDTNIADTPLISPSLTPGGSKSIDQKKFRFLENVIQVPDPSITIRKSALGVPIDGTGQEYFAGQFVNIDDYIAEISSRATMEEDGANGKDSIILYRTITKEFLRKVLLNGNGYSYEALIADFDLSASRSSWARRIDAIKSHYRKTFRIYPFWRNRMSNTKATRVAFVSPTEPLRAPSPVYMDYAKTFTVKGAMASGFSTGLLYNVINFDTSSIPRSKPCPWAEVNFFGAEENSIFSLSMNQDPYAINNKVLPCRVIDSPIMSLGTLGTLHCLDDRGILLPGFGGKTKESGVLDPNHEMATIITSTPVATPGVELFSVKVEPKDFYGPYDEKFKNANGPPMKIKVPASVMTAKFVWSDALAEKITEAFGVKSASDGSAENVTPDYEGLDPVFVNKTVVTELAKRFAEEQIRKYVPRFRGSIISGFTDTAPNGTISRISHTISPPSGKVTTQAIIDPVFSTPSWIQLLPMSARSLVQKFVKQDQPK